MATEKKFDILGGGVAGLSLARFLGRLEASCVVHEAGLRAGGNCRTLVWGEHRFDTGAHRLHDKLSEATRVVRQLPGAKLHSCDAPSRIVETGGMTDFPLRLANVASRLGLPTLIEAAFDVAWTRVTSRGRPENFGELARRRYGRALSRRFLLDYSEKLWGLPASELAVEVSGGRLKGLAFSDVLRDAWRSFGGRQSAPSHLDGSFLYPEGGFGAIADGLASQLGPGVLRLGSKVVEIRHDGKRIVEVTTTADGGTDVAQVVSTLPVPVLLRCLNPAPPADVLQHAGGLRHRALVLVVLDIAKPRVSPCASLYFPDPCTPVTRVTEPKNRCHTMSPTGSTCLVAELPCAHRDHVWAASTEQLREWAVAPLIGAGLLTKAEVQDVFVHRMSHAYPVLDASHTARWKYVEGWLGRFDNLHLMGRNGEFAYLHVHEILRRSALLAASLEHGSRQRCA